MLVEVKIFSISLLLLGTLILWGPASLAKSSARDTLYVNGRYDHPYLKLADSLAGKNMAYKALEAYKSAIQKFSADNNHQGKITAACKMGGIYIGLRQFDDAQKSLAEAFQTFKYIPKDSVLLADIFYRFGVLHDNQIQPDSALFYHQNALNIRKRSVGENSEPVASS